MLTQNDLVQFKEILQPINNRLDKIDNKLTEHDTQFDKIDKRFNKIDNKLTEHDTQFKIVNKQLKKIQKDLTITIKYFDNNCLTHKKHLNRIEQHLSLPQFSTT